MIKISFLILFLLLIMCVNRGRGSGNYIFLDISEQFLAKVPPLYITKKIIQISFTDSHLKVVHFINYLNAIYY